MNSAQTTHRKRPAVLVAASGLLASLVLTLLPSTASAEGSQLVTARIAKVSSSSITLQPITGDETALMLWDQKIAVKKDTMATLTNGTQVKFSKLRTGTMITARIDGKVSTFLNAYGCGILQNRKYGCGILLVPETVTKIEGSVAEITVLDGRCETKKKIQIGGGGEKTDVVLCRYRENGKDYYSVAVNTDRADHSEDVLAALASTGEVRIMPAGKTAPLLTARFTGQGLIALATTSSTGINAGTRVKVEIYADGPNDGQGMKVFKVTSSTKL